MASDLWTIPHSLNRYFNVVKVYDTSTGSDNEVGFEIPRDVTFEGPNIMVIRLISPSKGYVLYS